MNRSKHFRIISWAAVAAVCGAPWITVSAEESPKTTIEVDIRQQKAPVPASLYGIFMEELSHAFDGGIYAELITPAVLPLSGCSPDFPVVLPPHSVNVLRIHAN